MSKNDYKFRIVIAQSILTEIVVRAPSREAAEDRAFALYGEPKPQLDEGQWVSDAMEIIDIQQL